MIHVHDVHDVWQDKCMYMINGKRRKRSVISVTRVKHERRRDMSEDELRYDKQHTVKMANTSQVQIYTCLYEAYQSKTTPIAVQ